MNSVLRCPRGEKRRRRMASDREITVTCPVPFVEHQKIMLAHGGGGRLMHRLLDDVILPALHNDILGERHDCALLPTPATARLAFTTDSWAAWLCWRNCS